ncbi:MAG TPA: hypothetical protein PKX07_20105, partial [Aggregatilineales bacterium]|nr:hypothetical protein [Aggregatilineales bacterium]
MNEHPETPEDTMHEITDFETILSAAAPLPHADWESALAQQLHLEFKQRHRARQMLRTASARHPSGLNLRGMALLLLVLLGGVGMVFAVNSILRQFIQSDSGLNAVFERGEGSALDLSQTQGAFTLNLQWANADDHRLTLGFSLTGPECAAEHDFCDIGVSVTDAQGRDIPLLDGRAYEQATTRDYLYNFDLAGVDLAADSFGFQLSVVPYAITHTEPVPDRPGVTNTRSERLSEPIVLNAVISTSRDVRLFTDSLASANADITLTLRRVTVTPSQTRVAICFEPPSADRSWTAIPWLRAGGTAVAGGGAVQPVTGIGEASNEVCSEFIYNAAMSDYSGSWLLEISELIGFGSGGGADQQRIAG